MSKPLSKKHIIFINEYLKTFNATKAYLTVYPNSGYDSARANSARLIARDNISSEMRARLDDMHMTADEALKLTTEIARGDIAELMDISSVGFYLDMSKAKEAGMTGLIKKVKQKTTTYQAKKESEEDREVTELEIELYDRQVALRDILKIHGRFTEHLDLSNSDGTLRPETMAPSEIAERVDALLKAKDAK